MAEKERKSDDKASAAAPSPGQAKASSPGGAAGLVKSTPVLLGAVMLVEAGVLFAGFKFLGGGGLYAGISNGIRVTVKNNGTKVVNEAARHKGALYLYGAAGPKRFDCSGFTMYVYKKTTGRKLPHKANSQQKYGKAVSKGKKRVGDLIIFRSGSYGYHAAVYAGGGKIWDSPHSGARVSKRKMFGSNYVVRRLV